MTKFLNELFASTAQAQAFPTPTLPLGSAGTEITINRLVAIVTQVAQFLIAVAPVFAVIFLIWGGIAYMAAGADEEKAKNAKARIRNAIIGAFVIFGAGLILQTVSGIISRGGSL